MCAHFNIERRRKLNVASQIRKIISICRRDWTENDVKRRSALVFRVRGRREMFWTESEVMLVRFSGSKRGNCGCRHEIWISEVLFTIFGYRRSLLSEGYFRYSVTLKGVDKRCFDHETLLVDSQISLQSEDNVNSKVVVFCSASIGATYNPVNIGIINFKRCLMNEHEKIKMIIDPRLRLIPTNAMMIISPSSLIFKVIIRR